MFVEGWKFKVEPTLFQYQYAGWGGGVVGGAAGVSSKQFLMGLRPTRKALKVPEDHSLNFEL